MGKEEIAGAIERQRLLWCPGRDSGTGQSRRYDERLGVDFVEA